MTYKQFAKWVEDKRVLIGFDLTDQLLQQVFSEIDPHKKGYVTLDDWLNAFAGYTWEEQMFKEVQQ
jgi:Ca2+-binding EF-hand superfamily protein